VRSPLVVVGGVGGDVTDAFSYVSYEYEKFTDVESGDGDFVEYERRWQ